MERKEPEMSTTSLVEHSRLEIDAPVADVDRHWKPGFVNQFPYMGFGALIGVIVCLFASVVVLIYSDGKTQTTTEHHTAWPAAVSPNVLLSIFSNLANLCLGAAVAQGVAISWWRKTMKGAKLRGLNRSWLFSYQLKDAVFAGRHFNIIALAALAAKMTFIDSTLLQKSSSTYSLVELIGLKSNVVQGYINETFPLTGRGWTDWALQPWFSADLQIWQTGGGLYPNEFANVGPSISFLKTTTTYLNMSGAGLAMDCDQPVSTALNTSNMLWPLGTNLSASNQLQLFSIDFTAYWGSTDYPWLNETGWILMNITHANISTALQSDLSGSPYCSGGLQNQICRLRPAVITYPVRLTQTENKDQDSDSSGQASLSVQPNISLADFYQFNYQNQQQNFFTVERYQAVDEQYVTKTSNLSGDADDVIGGIASALRTYLGGSASLARNSSGQYAPTIQGSAQTYLFNLPHEGACNFGFADPFEGGNDLVAHPHVSDGNAQFPDSTYIDHGLAGKINEIMWGLATDVSSTDPNNDYVQGWNYQGWDAVVWADTVHYSTNILYMIGAIISTIVCILLILPSYWGFWQLGHKVALGPFEIAAAFGAPDLRPRDATTVTAEELLESVGNVRVRFGRIVDQDGSIRMGIRNEAAVQPVAK